MREVKGEAFEVEFAQLGRGLVSEKARHGAGYVVCPALEQSELESFQSGDRVCTKAVE